MPDEEVNEDQSTIYLTSVLYPPPLHDMNLFRIFITCRIIFFFRDVDMDYFVAKCSAKLADGCGRSDGKPFEAIVAFKVPCIHEPRAEDGMLSTQFLT